MQSSAPRVQVHTHPILTSFHAHIAHAQSSTHTSASVRALTAQRAASRSTAQRAAQLQCQVRAHDSSRYFRYIPVGQRGQALGEAEGVKVHPPIQSSGVRFPPIIWCPCQSSGAPIQSSGIPSPNHLAPIIWRTRVRVANRLAFLKTTHLVLSHSSGFKRVRRELDSRFDQTTLDPRTSYRDAEPPTPGRNHLRLRTGPCNGNSSG